MKLSDSHALRPLFELAERDPNRTLITFVDDNGKDTETRTASQLVDRVTRLATYLRDGCGLQKGDIALLIYPPSMEFIEGFAACLLAGVVAAPVYPPNLARPQSDLTRLRAIAERSGAKAILTNRAYRWASRLSVAKEMLGSNSARWPALPWYVTQGLGWFSSKSDYAPECKASDLAILQFTSGSTSLPKGVRLTHGNLTHQLAFNAEALDMGIDSRFVMWVPQYHDLGLISGIVSSLSGHGSLWFTSPLSFLKRPALWFDMADRVRATHIAGPNFSYELVTRKTTAEQRAQWNLSGVRVFMSAAEPIVPRTVDKFMEAFASSKLSPKAFCPAYGLAEHTVGVTIGGRKRVKVDRRTLVNEQKALIDPLSDLEFIGCGEQPSDIRVRIVDPVLGKVVNLRTVGEIWVQSDSVADGYQGLPEESLATFGATLEEETGSWLRTGDLGFLHENELFITGRQKDLIIIRGRNIHPEDVEESVRHVHPDIRAGGVAAFSVPGDSTEELVVLVEVTTQQSEMLDEILAAVKNRLGEVWHIPGTVAVVAPRAVRKTTSGKIQRAACRKAWMDGQLDSIRSATSNLPTLNLVSGDSISNIQLSDIPIEERVDWLQEQMRQVVLNKLPNNTRVGPDDFLPDVGLDSLASTELIATLETSLDIRLSTSLFIEHPTLKSAAMRILSDLGLEYVGAPTQLQMDPPMSFRPAHRGMAPASTRVGIIGGGVGGLISALELARIGYKDIVIYESSAQCGGKVLTKMVGPEHIELGQNFFGDSFRTIIELAKELDVEIAAHRRVLTQWDEEYGFEDAPARNPARNWIKSLASAQRVDMNPSMPFPSMISGADESFSQFLKRHNLRQPHPLFYFDWNAMGYGQDLDIPASYIIAYFQVVGALSNTCFIRKGNQFLWTTLARYLQEMWGVSIRYNKTVTKLESDETGVTVWCQNEKDRFNELILAAPPTTLTQILPSNDPLQNLLSKFEYYAYAVRSFEATGLPTTTGMFLPTVSNDVGRMILVESCHQQTGWFVCGQYASTYAKDTVNLSDAQLENEIRETVKKMGGYVGEFGPSYTWNYFPHVRKNPSEVMREAESLQGTRHIWTTGSWISFETTEHVARHARHLIRTCFDPAGT